VARAARIYFTAILPVGQSTGPTVSTVLLYEPAEGDSVWASVSPFRKHDLDDNHKAASEQTEHKSVKQPPIHGCAPLWVNWRSNSNNDVAAHAGRTLRQDGPN
jgi:hypothetical protein